MLMAEKDIRFLSFRSLSYHLSHEQRALKWNMFQLQREYTENPYLN